MTLNEAARAFETAATAATGEMAELPEVNPLDVTGDIIVAGSSTVFPLTEALAERLQGLIVTLGAQGSRIYTEGRVIEVATPPASEIVDPTGCGDAYRGGLLYGLSHGWTLEKSAQLASVMGSIKIAHRGGQNYSPSRDDIAARFAAAFGAQPW